jgi:hypothetical protein
VRAVVTATTGGGTTTARSAPSWPIGRTAGAGVGGSGTGLRDVVAGAAAAGGGGRGRVTVADDELPVPGPVYVPGLNGVAADGTARIDASSSRSGLITGRLTTKAGAPIADAQIDVIVHVAVAGATGQVAGAVTTDAAGEFRYRPQRGVSRIFTFGYRASLADDVYLDHASVAAPTVAAVSLTASGSRLRNGQVLRLSGAVAPAPPGTRNTVDVQTLTERGWKTIATPRLREGAFAWTHRFTRTTSPATYRFRVVAAGSGDWPLQRGVSQQRSVRVLP